MTTINSQKMLFKASKNTFIKLQNALKDAGEYGRRHDYSFRASNGATESTKDLSERECGIILNELKDKFGVGSENAGDKMRKKIISLAHQMYWELPGGNADMQRINEWCAKQGPFQKLLNDHTEKELLILVSVFEKIYKQYINKL